MAKDEFTIPLKCPKCEKSGEAKCWQQDGWAFVRGDRSTRVIGATAGFSRVKERSYWGDDVNFICDKCGELSAQGPRIA